MENLTYNLNFQKLCKELSLGSLSKKPQRVYGGLLHKMYKLKTEKGSFAVKALNPQIMQRATAMKNYIFSEKAVRVAFNNGINAVPAMSINGNCIHEIEGQYYLVFQWVNGKALEQNIIDIHKCKIIGSLLAKIHSLDFSSIPISKAHKDTSVTDWTWYIQQAKKHNLEWTDNLLENIDKIVQIEKQANTSTQKIAENVVISHRDLDQKNVLWDKNDIPIIIDWESAGAVNPFKELIEVALYWSRDGSTTPSKEAFCAVVNSYYENREVVNIDFEDILNSIFLGSLEWLIYNMRRSLRIECSSDEEQELGTAQVIQTTKSIFSYYDQIPVLQQWLNSITKSNKAY